MDRNWIQSLIDQESYFIPPKSKTLTEIKTNKIPLEYIQTQDIYDLEDQIFGIIQNFQKTLNLINSQTNQITIVEEFHNSILLILFKNVADNNLKNLHEKLGQGKSGVCGKILRSGDIGYKCLDCGFDSSCIICKECFQNGFHQNHRYVLKQYCGGCCDCGDPEAWNPKGFCINHKGFEQFTDEQIKEILGDKMYNSIKQIFFILLYCLIQTTELIMCKSLNTRQQKDLNSIFYGENKKLDILFQTIIYEIIRIIDKVPMLMKIFSQALMTNLSLTPNFKLFHDCQNYSYFKIFYNDQKQVDNGQNIMRPCQCSFLQNLFRIGLIFSTENLKMLQELLIQLFNFYDFKQFLALTYCQMINFHTIIDFGNSDMIKRSKLIDLDVQLLTSDELSSYVLQNLKEKKVLFEKSLQLMKNIEKVERESCFFDNFKQIDYISEKPLSLQHFLENPELFQYLLDFAVVLDRINVIKNRKPIFKDDSKFLIHIVNIEIKVLSVFQKIIAFTKIYETFCKERNIQPLNSSQNILIGFLKQAIQKLGNQNIKHQLMITVNRVISMIIASIFQFDQDENQQKQILKEGLSNDEFSQIILGLFQRNLNCLQTVKKLQINAYGLRQTDFLLEYPQIYNINHVTQLISLDTILLQNCLNLLCIGGGSISRLFSHMKFKQAKDAEKRFLKFEFFVNILLFLINDQKCIANYNIQISNCLQEICQSYFSRYPILQQFCLDYNQKNISLMVNPVISDLQKYSSFTLKDLKKDLDKSLDIKNSELESLLQHIAEFNKQTKRFYLKSQYQNKYINPFNSYFNDTKNHDFRQGLRSRFKNDQFMIFSNLGVQEDNIILPQYLSSLKKFVFKSDLFELILNFLSTLTQQIVDQTKMNKTLISLINLINESIKMINNNPDCNQDNMEQQQKQIFNYIRKIIDILNQNQNNQKFNEEVNICFKYVTGLFSQIQQRFQIQNETDLNLPAENQSDNEKNKRISILKKKEELLKKFQQKQKTFEKKFEQNLDSLQDNIKCCQIEENDNNQTNQFVCNFCRQTLNLQPDNSNQLWGYSAYASLSNADQYLKFKKQEQQLQMFQLDDQMIQIQKRQLLQKICRNGTYQFQSCHHPIHKECYFRVLNSVNQNFISSGEYLCPLCKCLCNIFVPYLYLQAADVNQDFKFTDLNTEQSSKQIEVQKPEQKQFNTDQVNEFIENFALVPFQHDLSFYQGQKQRDFPIEFQDSIIQTVINIIDYSLNQDSFKQISFLKNQIKILRFMVHGNNQMFKNLQNQNSELLNQIQQQIDSYLNSREQEKQNKIEQQVMQIQNLEVIENLNLPENADIQKMLEENEWESEVDSNEQYEDGSYQEEIIIETEDLNESSNEQRQFQNNIRDRVDTNIESNDKGQQNIEKNLLRYLIIFCCTYKIDLNSTKQLQSIINQFVFLRIVQLLQLEQIRKENNLYINFFNQNYQQLQNLQIDAQNIKDTVQNPGIINDCLKKFYIKIKMILSLFCTIDDITIFGDDKNIIFPGLTLNEQTIQRLFDKLQIQNFIIDIPFEDFLLENGEDLNENSFMQLKENWAQISSHYIHSRCSLCKDLPQGGIKQVVCLICQKIICSQKCKTNESRMKSKIGNLNLHSIQFHQGQSLFMSLSDSQIIAIKSPLNHLYGGIYVNQYGEEFKNKFSKWNDFEVDKHNIIRLYRKLIFGEIGSDIVQKILRDNALYKLLTL